MHRLVPAILALILVPVVAASGSVPHAVGQAGCGVERWAVKVLADDDATSVDLTPVPETVADLVALPAPDVLPSRNRIAPVELTTFVLTVNLVEARLEADSDIHLVIADPDTGDMMIAELPDAADCALTTDPTLAAEMQAARDSFVSTFGMPSRQRFTPENGTATITGVGFFDFQHGQRGVAPNGIELHPLLDFQGQAALLPTPLPPPVAAPAPLAPVPPPAPAPAPLAPVPAPTPAPAVTSPAPTSSCCRVCSTGKACGNSCISRNLTCHQPAGCACNAAVVGQSLTYQASDAAPEYAEADPQPSCPYAGTMLGWIMSGLVDAGDSILLGVQQLADVPEPVMLALLR